MNTQKNSSDWDKVKLGVTQGSKLGLLFFLLYNDDLPYIINNTSQVILFSDNTSIIFYNSDSTDYATEFIATFDKINFMVRNQFIIVNLNATSYVHCTSKTNIKIDKHKFL